MKSLHTNHILRRFFLPLFARLNPGNILIKHHYTGQRFQLHSFKHKNYWFHGMNREKPTMSLFGKLIEEGATIFEVGGHIGYISLYFSQLVGDSGRVIVFEPGPNNIPYLLKNTSKQNNITIVQKAVSDTDSRQPFYVEDFSGQNNTLIKDFEGLAINSGHAYVKKSYDTIMVDVVKLDSVASQLSSKIDFIKIDVEGVELSVLEGAKNTIDTQFPIVMVESIDTDEGVYKYFSEIGYMLFSPENGLVHDPSEMKTLNYFCVHPEKHQEAFMVLTQLT